MVKPILPKELFIKIDLTLDKPKSIIILYRFKTLYLYIVYYFYHILAKTVLKDFLFNGLLFKFEISLIFVKKISGVRKISKDIRS